MVADTWRDCCAVTDDREFIEIPNAFTARALDDQIVEQAVDAVGDDIAFPSSIASRDRLDHGTRLVDQKDEAARIRPTDFR